MYPPVLALVCDKVLEPSLVWGISDRYNIVASILAILIVKVVWQMGIPEKLKTKVLFVSLCAGVMVQRTCLQRDRGYKERGKRCDA